MTCNFGSYVMLINNNSLGTNKPISIGFVCFTTIA